MLVLYNYFFDTFEWYSFKGSLIQYWVYVSLLWLDLWHISFCDGRYISSWWPRLDQRTHLHLLSPSIFLYSGRGTQSMVSWSSRQRYSSKSPNWKSLETLVEAHSLLICFYSRSIKKGIKVLSISGGIRPAGKRIKKEDKDPSFRKVFKTQLFNKPREQKWRACWRFWKSLHKTSCTWNRDADGDEGYNKNIDKKPREKS